MADKIYINNINVKENQYSINVSMNFDKFIEECRQHVNDKGYLNLSLGKRKEKGKYGETHYCTINEWKPKQETKTIETSVEDLPF